MLNSKYVLICEVCLITREYGTKVSKRDMKIVLCNEVSFIQRFHCIQYILAMVSFRKSAKGGNWEETKHLGAI